MIGKFKILAASTALVVASAGALAPVASAATKPAPPIESTHQYRALSNYVDVLAVKSQSSQTPTQIAKYKTYLRNHRSLTDAKVRSLYQVRVSNSKMKKKAEQHNINYIVATYNTQIVSVKNSKYKHVKFLKNQNKVADAVIHSQYDGQLKKLTTEQSSLKSKILKAKSSKKKNILKLQLAAINNDKKAVSKTMNSQLGVKDRYYGNLEDTVKRDAFVKLNELRQTRDSKKLAARNLMNQNYQSRIQHAKDIRTESFNKVKNLYYKGFGYINKM